MRRSRLPLALALALAPALAAHPAAAQTTLAQNTTQPTDSYGGAYGGQSATTPTGGPFGGITFNFYSDFQATTPTAAGTLFVLTQAYAGTPGALSASAAGYLAQSTGIVGGVYQFDPGVTLAGGTQYFFYGNAVIPLLRATNGNSYTGGNLYLSFGGGFLSNPGDADFRLAGTAVTAAPEPATWALLGTGLLAVGGMARRRRGTQA